MINNIYFKNISKIFSMEILAKALFSIISLGIIRFLSQDEFAIYIIALSTISIITSSVGAVFNRLFIAGKFDQNKFTFLPFFLIQMALLILLFLFFLPIKSIYNGNLDVVFYASGLQVLLIFIQTSFQKELKFNKYYLSEYLRLFVYLLLFVFLFLNDFLNARNILSIQAISAGISSLIFISKVSFKRESFLFKKIISLFRVLINGSNKYLIFYSIIVILISSLDTILIRIFDDTNQVAIFGAAFTYFGILQAILYAINKLYLPMLQKTNSLREINSAMDTLNNLNTRYLSILFVMIILSAPFLIPIIDNGKYPESILIFQILGISSFFSLVLSPYKNIIFKFGDNKYIFKIYFLSLIIVYGIILPNIIIRYHALGVAVVFLLNWFTVNFLSYLRAKKILKIIDMYGWDSLNHRN